MKEDFNCNGRFMLWIDSVGGYMVSLADEVILGQPNQDGAADVRILGDLGARHAVLRRDAEGYSIEALREVNVNGRPVRGEQRLHDGSALRLGESVHLLFRRPHAFSNSARLELVSPHRTQPSADAILLLGDTCLLGPGLRSHVVCRAWRENVLLYPREGELFCRADGPMTIDGVAREGSVRLRLDSQVEGKGFSFNLDPIAE